MRGRDIAVATSVPRIHVASAEWSEERPVLIEGALEDMAALARWSPDYVARAAGWRTVALEFSVRPIYRPDPRVNGGRYQRKDVTLREALHAVAARVRGPYHYLSTLDVRTQVPELAADVRVPPVLAGRGRLRGIYMFIGGAGTGSQTHYDLTDNFVAVFRGRKRVLLWGPGQFSTFEPQRFVYPLCHMSRIDPGPEGWPGWMRTRGVGCYECEVGPGEMLFIPLHWWHFVRNEDLTLGVTYSFDVELRRRASWRHVRVDLRGRVGRWLGRPLALGDRFANGRNAALTPSSPSPDTARMRPVLAAQTTTDVVPLEFVLRHARLTGHLEFARSAARAFVIAREARRQSIEAGDEAVQEAANAFRRQRGLSSARATEQWLADAGLTVAEFEERIRADVTARLVRDAVTRDEVAAFFEQSKAEFEMATLSHIRHQDEGVIREIRVIEADGERDFHALARQCSEDEQTAPAGGYVGAVSVAALPNDLRHRVRAAKPGDVLGPIYHDGAWELYKLEAYSPPALDEAARERASRLLFDRWLDAELAGVRVEALDVVL